LRELQFFLNVLMQLYIWITCGRNPVSKHYGTSSRICVTDCQFTHTESVTQNLTSFQQNCSMYKILLSVYGKHI
jgi:hypothetical protein